MTMKKTKLVLALTMAAVLAACGGGDDNANSLPEQPGTGQPGPEQPKPDPEPQPEPQPAVLLDESFEGLSALPTGWTLPAANRGTVSVRDGSLFIDGRAHSSQMTAVMLPAALQDLSNYRIDVVFTFSDANNASRWGSVMYRSAPASATIAHEPYYQFAIRQAATAANGTEFALRKNGQWNVQATKAFGENLDPNKTYTATVVVHGNRVRQYLDNQLTHDMTLDEAMAKGGIGLQNTGLVMRVDSIKVTEQLKALPEIGKIVAVQDTGTLAAMAPTLVQAMAAGTDVPASGASNALYRLDAGLNLHAENGESLGALASYLTQSGRATIPVLRIADQATVSALAAFSSDNDLGDVTLLSDDVALLASARTAMPAVRTAVDFSRLAILGNSPQDILQVVSATNRAKAKIAVLPPGMTNRATVAHLQRLLITAWTRSDASTASDAAAVLTTGVNGVLSADAAVFAKVMRALPAGTLLRKPLITGHRGMPSTEDENTLEGARAAVAAGADAVENDIYKTTDGHLVIMHDATVNRTTDGTGNIESMTLAQVQALRTKSKGYAVPTLREFFQAFKGRPTMHFVEIKSGHADIVPLLKQELDAMGVRDQVVAISFDGNQLTRMAAALPEVTVGLLNSAAGGSDPLVDVRTILGATQQYSSTFNPSYGNLTAAAMEAAKHRGTTFWPWTLNDQDAFYRFYSYGTHGLTTDYAWWAKDFPVEISSAASASSTAGQPFSMPVALTTQAGAPLNASSNAAAVVDATAPYSVAADGTLTFTGPGTAVVLPGYRHTMGSSSYSYVIVAKPVRVTVQ